MYERAYNLRGRLLTGILVTAILGSVQGCVTPGPTDAAIALDSSTTFTALHHGIGKEMNPLLGNSSIGASIGSAVLSSVIMAAIPESKPHLCRLKVSVSANNLAVLAGVAGSAALAPAVAAYLMSGNVCSPVQHTNPEMYQLVEGKHLLLARKGNTFIATEVGQPASTAKLQQRPALTRAVMQTGNGSFITTGQR